MNILNPKFNNNFKWGFNLSLGDQISREWLHSPVYHNIAKAIALFLINGSDVVYEVISGVFQVQAECFIVIFSFLLASSTLAHNELDPLFTLDGVG